MTLLSVKQHKARKEYKCQLSFIPVQKGETYTRQSIADGGTVYSFIISAKAEFILDNCVRDLNDQFYDDMIRDEVDNEIFREIVKDWFYLNNSLIWTKEEAELYNKEQNEFDKDIHYPMIYSYFMNRDSYTIHMDTPIGMIPIRKDEQNKLVRLSDIELAERALGGKFVDPEAFAVLNHRGLVHRGDKGLEDIKKNIKNKILNRKNEIDNQIKEFWNK